MQLLILIVLSLIFSACNNGNSNHRGYVISQSHETAAETEAIIEALPSE